MNPEEKIGEHPDIPAAVLPPRQRLERRRRIILLQRVLASFLFLVLLLLGVLYFSLDTFSTPRGVRVEGNSLLSRDLALELAGLRQRRSLLFLDSKNAEEQVLANGSGVVSDVSLSGSLFGYTMEVEEVVPVFRAEDGLRFSDGSTLPEYQRHLEEALSAVGSSSSAKDEILGAIVSHYDDFLTPHGPASMAGDWGGLLSDADAYGSYFRLDFSFLAGQECLVPTGIEFPQATPLSFGESANILLSDPTAEGSYLIKDVPLSSLSDLLSASSLPSLRSQMEKEVDAGMAPLETFAFADAPSEAYSCYIFALQGGTLG